jgi:ribonuclease HI
LIRTADWRFSGNMPLTPEIKKLARQALAIQDSQVPLHRVIDVLATADGDISKAVNRYRDIKDANLRRALHYCAELLRAIEQEAGLTPGWEAGLRAEGVVPAPAKAAESAAPSKSKFAPDELTPFVDDASRGQVRVAKAYVDGASKGNPGEAGIGVAIFSMDGKKIAQQSKAIGLATNNIAEYSALIECLRIASDMQIKHLNVIGDSELMVKQVNGVYKIKNTEILKKVQEVMALKKNFEKFSLSYVGREHNQLADALSTAQLKKKKGGASAAIATGEYRDFMGEVDPDADEGTTE